MATNENVTIDTGLAILRSGIVTWSDIASTTYVVLDRAECDELFDGDVSNPVNSRQHVATALTGWGEFSRGHGRAFGYRPSCKVFGRKVLVTWYRGIDC